MPRLCGYCGGAVDSIISVFTQLHRSSSNLQFETCLSQSGTSLLIYYREKAKQESFQRKDTEIVLRFAPHFLKGGKCSLMNRQHCQPFKEFNKNSNTALESFLWTIT